MAGALPFIAPVLGAVDSLVSSNAQNHATQQAQTAANQDAQNQQRAIDAQNALAQQSLAMQQMLANDYQQNYAGLEPILSQAFSTLGTDTGGQLSALEPYALQALTDPSARDAYTGIPLQAAFGSDYSFLADPGGRLAGLGGAGGDALSFYAQEAQRGLDPATIGAAIERNDTSNLRNINSIRNSLGSNVSNLSGLVGDLGQHAFESDLSLQNQLAGQNQMFRNQGMASALETAQGIDTNTLQSLGAAYGLAQGQSQSQLGNLLQGLGIPSQYLQAAEQYLGQGRNFIPGVASGIGNLSSIYGNIGAQYGLAGQGAAQNAYNAQQTAAQNNPFSTLGSIFANSNPLAGLFSGGGASAPFAIPAASSSVPAATVGSILE